MEILYDVYKEIINKVPDQMPETGGILGGHKCLITKVIFDVGIKDNVQICHYAPDVCKLNKCLSVWLKQGIELYGLFHTHFFSSGIPNKICFIYAISPCESDDTLKKCV